jgi:hypothetical protein
MIVRNADGAVLPGRSSANLLNKSDVVSKFFTPDEIGGVSDLLKLVNRMGEPVASSSGTSSGIAFRDVFKRATSAATSRTSL